MQISGSTRYGHDSRKDNGTPALNASLHWAALSERQRGITPVKQASYLLPDDFPSAGVEDK